MRTKLCHANRALQLLQTPGTNEVQNAEHMVEIGEVLLTTSANCSLVEGIERWLGKQTSKLGVHAHVRVCGLLARPCAKVKLTVS